MSDRKIGAADVPVHHEDRPEKGEMDRICRRDAPSERLTMVDKVVGDSKGAVPPWRWSSHRPRR
jgi:hypothetical protein